MKEEVVTTKIRKRTLENLKLIKSLLIVKGLKQESYLEILERLMEVEVDRIQKIK